MEGIGMTTHTDLFRVLLDDQDMHYEIQDFKTRKITYIEVTLDGEPFEVEFSEPLDGIPETLGAMRELTLTSCNNITAWEAFKALMEVIDR